MTREEDERDEVERPAELAHKAMWVGSGLCGQQDSGAWAKFACSNGEKRTYNASSKYAVAMKLAMCAPQHMLARRARRWSALLLGCQTRAWW